MVASMSVQIFLIAGFATGCVRSGLLVDDPRFDDSRILFPDNYSACNQGRAAACEGLALDLAKWSGDSRYPPALELDRVACSRGAVGSCVQLAILDFRSDPSAKTSLREYCVSERRLAACEFLAQHESTEAAQIGCELGSHDACSALSRLWHLARPQPDASGFFARLCSEANAEACALAGDWSTLEPNDVRRLRWFDKACRAGSFRGCQHIAGVLVSDPEAQPDQFCESFGESIVRACIGEQWRSSCLPAVFCRAVAGNGPARRQLQSACRNAPDSQECGLLFRLPHAPPD